MNNKILLFVSLIIALGFSSCKDQDDIYKEWVVPGGRVYPEKTNGLAVYAGHNRVLLKWVAPKDPSVEKAVISWSAGDESLVLNYADYAGEDTIELSIDNLEERTYTFEIKNYDDKGNESMSSEVSKAPYASNWLASLSERTIESAEVVGDEATVTTGFMTDNMVYTEYRYVTTDDETVTLEEKQTNESREVKLPNAKPGKRFEYRSYYVPTEGVDTICNEWRKSPTPIAGLLDKSGFIATATDTRSGYSPMGIFDGVDNNNTGSWRSGNTTYPKFIFIDLNKDSYILNRIYVVAAVYQSPIGYNQTVKLYWGMEPFEATLGDKEYEQKSAFASAVAAGNYRTAYNPYWGNPRGVDAKFTFMPVRYACIVFTDVKSGTNNVTETYIYGYDTAAD
ncbi:MAG: DUF4998 domain-containing protein [Prevotellaceae bacterium]|nr:DUF4998 domain-containing protein [Prevotellaceae bacterium]